ncbi:hypothetical protein GEMRC1_010914 [Eukaryota sp. GEM-RC1]
MLTVWGQELPVVQGEECVLSDILPSLVQSVSCSSSMFLKCMQSTKTLSTISGKSTLYRPPTLIVNGRTLKQLPINEYFDALVVHIKTKPFEEQSSAFKADCVYLFALVSDCGESPCFITVSYQTSMALYETDGDSCFPNVSDVVLVKNLIKQREVSSQSNILHCFATDTNDFVQSHRLPKAQYRDSLGLVQRYISDGGFERSKNLISHFI